MTKKKARRKLKASSWFEEAQLSDQCTSGDVPTRCPDCKANGDCESCDTIDGRWITAVSDYASTCDGCGELCSHEIMTMDPKTQLGYCPECAPKQPAEVRARYGMSIEDFPPLMEIGPPIVLPREGDFSGFGYCM